ncbi:ankyrin [Aspergillus sclerotioniger CBS 115572]|uniref:Ankyrin n=1 Tax=Aspergillus sclerotioniger CBS 115572 TaxID=1450535 RepID=A0A317WYZ1_9EURO|nr:ankyrin [Aspergillus sclerotioniger CBS 115572]PWY91589.1 ankyrin [Aspergillus sclerotioniger CBS 115572]
MFEHGATCHDRLPEFDDGTPLIVAAKHDEVSLIPLLLEAGAELMDTDSRGLTAWLLKKDSRILLVVAAKHSTPECVQLLLDLGANIESVSLCALSSLVQNAEGNTLLHIAAARRSLPLVELLLRQGANVDPRNLDVKPFYFRLDLAFARPVTIDLRMDLFRVPVHWSREW